MIGALLVFLLATPLHLILVDRLGRRRAPAAWTLALAYLVFPVAILLLAVTGGYRGVLDRLLLGFPGCGRSLG